MPHPGLFEFPFGKDLAKLASSFYPVEIKDHVLWKGIRDLYKFVQICFSSQRGEGLRTFLCKKWLIRELAVFCSAGTIVQEDP
jgi:hypothetical protein